MAIRVGEGIKQNEVAAAQMWFAIYVVIRFKDGTGESNPSLVISMGRPWSRYYVADRDIDNKDE